MVRIKGQCEISVATTVKKQVLLPGYQENAVWHLFGFPQGSVMAQ